LTDDADPAQWIAEAAAVYAGPVEVPDDGTVFEVA
jgi:ribonuclease BN (tRNA processing enzyme)